MLIFRNFLIAVVFVPLLATGYALAAPGVLGYVEYIYLQPWGYKIKSKLDTGAKTSSIYAVDIELFEKDGEEWVSFTMPFDQDEEVEPIHIEKKVSRTVLIKHKSGKSRRRYVVEFDICLDGNRLSSEFTLANREGFLYSVLLGRNTLKGNALIDPAEAFLSSGECAGMDDS